MKRFFYASIMALFATTASAEVNFVNAGSETGVFKQMFDIVGQHVEHKFIQASTPVNALTYFNEGPSFTVWSSEWPGNPEFISPDITGDNLVALVTYDTIMCSRQYKSVAEMSGATVKVATWGSVAAERFLKQFGEANNITFVVVPYDGSGATTKGYIANDADTIFTITSKQSAIEEDAASTCFASSQTGELSFKFVDAMITVNADSDTTNMLRAEISSDITTAEWQDVFAGSTTVVATDENTASLLDTYSVAVKNFAQ